MTLFIPLILRTSVGSALMKRLICFLYTLSLVFAQGCGQKNASLADLTIPGSILKTTRGNVSDNSDLSMTNFSGEDEGAKINVTITAMTDEGEDVNARVKASLKPFEVMGSVVSRSDVKSAKIVDSDVSYSDMAVKMANGFLNVRSGVFKKKNKEYKITVGSSSLADNFKIVDRYWDKTLESIK